MTPTLTPEIDLDALEAIAKAATLGPWLAERDLPINRKSRIYAKGGAGKLIAECGNAEPFTQDEWEANAAFIAEMRNSAPALIAAARETASLRTQLAEANARAESWRCFHCDEVFTTREEAAAHFGYSECSAPACRVNGGLASAYRELEGRWSRCQNECCDHLNAYYAKRSEHNQALIREEEYGYAKGVADMRDQLADANARVDKAEAERNDYRVWLQDASEKHYEAYAKLVAQSALIEKAAALLRSCLSDYGHPNFTDRHGMADRLRNFLADLTAAIRKGEWT